MFPSSGQLKIYQIKIQAKNIFINIKTYKPYDKIWRLKIKQIKCECRQINKNILREILYRIKPDYVKLKLLVNTHLFWVKHIVKTKEK